MEEKEKVKIYEYWDSHNPSPGTYPIKEGEFVALEDYEIQKEKARCNWEQVLRLREEIEPLKEKNYVAVKFNKLKDDIIQTLENQIREQGEEILNQRKRISECIEAITNQATEIERLKGLFEKSFEAGRDYQAFKYDGYGTAYPDFETWKKENNL